jgi:hypothetical protein
VPLSGLPVLWQFAGWNAVTAAAADCTDWSTHFRLRFVGDLEQELVRPRLTRLPVYLSAECVARIYGSNLHKALIRPAERSMVARNSSTASLSAMRSVTWNSAALRISEVAFGAAVSKPILML